VIAGCLPGYDRKGEWLDAMRGEGFRVHAAEGDVSKFDSCAEMFYHIRSVVGPVEILVNNAGITRDSVLKRMTASQLTLSIFLKVMSRVMPALLTSTSTAPALA